MDFGLTSFLSGAPRKGGAPLLFGLLFALAAGFWIRSATAAAAPELPLGALMLPSAEGNSGTPRVTVLADQLTYEEDSGRIAGKGHVRVWYGTLTLTAESADADLETRLLHAEGNVTLLDSGRTIRCARLRYNLRTGSAKADGILFATLPWFYQGTRVEKFGAKQVVITEPLFTTCDRRQPHYHLTASRIEVVMGEGLTAYDAVLYVGTTPLFYVPWFSRSLKDQRPPFSIRVGYNDTEGMYVKLRLNYFLLADNYGSLLFDVMQKRGLGYGLDEHVAYQFLGHGEGHFSGYYIRDQALLGGNQRDEELTRAERWNLQWDSRHDLGPDDALQASVGYISDRMLNQDFSAFSVDTFQQKSYLSYAHRATAYYLSMIAQDVEDFDPVSLRYMSSLRQLPEIDFSLNSISLGRLFAPVYFGLSSSVIRSYERVDTPGSGLDANGNAITDIHYRFQDSFNVTPTWTQTYSLPPYVPTQPSLSWSLGLPASGNLKESLVPGASVDEGQPLGRLNGAYNTSVTLTDKWVNYQHTRPSHLVQSRLTYGFSRTFSHLDDPNVANAGVTSDRMGAALDYFAGSLFSLQSQTGYSFLPLASATRDWRQMHLEPLQLNGRATPGSEYSVTWQGVYDWYLQHVSNGYLTGQTFGKNWSLALNGSYSFHPNLSGASNFQEQSVYGGLSGTYRLPLLGIALQSSLQYDFTANRFNNLSVNLSRDLHCWEMQVGFSHTFDLYGGRTDFGLGINLKAFPELRAGTGGPGGTHVGE